MYRFGITDTDTGATTVGDAVSAMYLPMGYLVYVSVTFRAPFIAFWLRRGIKLLFEWY